MHAQYFVICQVKMHSFRICRTCSKSNKKLKILPLDQAPCGERQAPGWAVANPTTIYNRYQQCTPASMPVGYDSSPYVFANTVNTMRSLPQQPPGCYQAPPSGTGVFAAEQLQPKTAGSGVPFSASSFNTNPYAPVSAGNSGYLCAQTMRAAVPTFDLT